MHHQKEKKYSQNKINRYHSNQPNLSPTTHGVANYRKNEITILAENFTTSKA